MIDKVFDSVVHIKKDGRWYGTDYDASLGRLLTEFYNNSFLKKAVLMGLPGDDHNYLFEIVKKHKEIFIPVGAITMKRNDSEEVIFKKITELKKFGFQGIKIHPRFLKMNLSDKNISVAIKLAGEQGMVSFLCTAHRSPSKPINRPLYDVIHEICDLNKKSKIILLHGGYFDIFATSEIIRPYENVLLDISFTLTRFQSTPILDVIKFLFSSFDKRLCIGSDFPENTISQVVKIIEEKILNSDSFEKSKLDNICYNNLDNIFKES